MGNCSHTLGPLSDMVTVSVTRDYYQRRCTVCKKEEHLQRAGKMWVGYSITAEQKRDTERRKYAKDILQPKDKKGKVSELFKDAYGDPYKKAEVGTDVEKYKI